MSSRVIKIQVCDKCGTEQRASAVATYPPGWGRLVRSGASQLDLCPGCTEDVIRTVAKKPT